MSRAQGVPSRCVRKDGLQRRIEAMEALKEQAKEVHGLLDRWSQCPYQAYAAIERVIHEINYAQQALEGRTEEGQRKSRLAQIGVTA